MKLTLNDLVNSSNSIDKLSMLDLGSASLNFKFMGVVESVKNNVQKYYSLTQKAMEKYCDKKKSKDGRYSIPTENVEKLNKELSDISNIEIDIDWTPVEAEVDRLTGFTAKDMQTLNGKFITIREGADNGD